jgi:hypothetical protein
MDGRRTFAILLCALVAWTVSIKYASPVLVARAEGAPLATYVMWDAWPLAHLALAWSLWWPGPSTWLLALVVAVAEVLVVATKFVAFLAAPAWSPWRANWFTNKCFVIALFLAMTVWLLRSRGGAALRRAK